MNIVIKTMSVVKGCFQAVVVKDPNNVSVLFAPIRYVINQLKILV